MSDRPEYVRCIDDQNVENAGKTWCGREVRFAEWTFTDVDHAAQTARAGFRLVPCPECVSAVMAALQVKP